MRSVGDAESADISCSFFFVFLSLRSRGGGGRCGNLASPDFPVTFHAFSHHSQTFSSTRLSARTPTLSPSPHHQEPSTSHDLLGSRNSHASPPATWPPRARASLSGPALLAPVLATPTGQRGSLRSTRPIRPHGLLGHEQASRGLLCLHPSLRHLALVDLGPHCRRSCMGSPRDSPCCNPDDAWLVFTDHACQNPALCLRLFTGLGPWIDEGERLQLNRCQGQRVCVG